MTKQFEAYIQGRWHKVDLVQTYTNHVTGQKLAMVEAVEHDKPFVMAASKYCDPQHSDYAFVTKEQIREVPQSETLDQVVERRR